MRQDRFRRQDDNIVLIERINTLIETLAISKHVVFWLETFFSLFLMKRDELPHENEYYVISSNTFANDTKCKWQKFF